MIDRYQKINHRLQREILELERTVGVVNAHWEKTTTTPAAQDAYMNSVALSLQSFYTGLERAFEVVATEFDGALPKTGAWHKELLTQMAEEVEGACPALLREETVDALLEYLKFRHVIRNIYPTQVKPERIGRLAETLPAAWLQVKADLEAFTTFLERMARADEG